MQTSKIPAHDERCSRPRLCGRISERGGALVELALLLPVFALLLVGAAEIARVEYTAIEVSNAAMAGVQYGAQDATTAADTTGIQNAAQNDAANITITTTVEPFACICSDGSASTCQPTDCSGSNIETILTVETQTSFDPVIHLPGLPTTFTLRGHATQKVLE
jgi:Flp pilus assembly protein TadG